MTLAIIVGWSLLGALLMVMTGIITEALIMDRFYKVATWKLNIVRFLIDLIMATFVVALFLITR